MRITSSSVELASTQVSYTVVTRQESLKVWVGDEPRQAAQAPAVRSTPTAIAPAVTVAAPTASAPQATDQAEDQGRARGRPHDELDLAILRKHFRLGRGLTRSAHEVRKAYADGQQAAADLQARAQAQASAAAAGPASPQPEGWGLRYDLTETSLQVEATHFAASAQVTTADGRAIAVQAALAMERTQVDAREVHLRAGDAAQVDPLVLNLAGGPARLEGRMSLDLDGDGAAETVAALGAGSAYLALDQDGNGAVDSGAELFGPTTGSGFGELQALDQDGNGWIDEGDAAFGRLQLWSPSSGTLGSLAGAGVGAISTRSVATPFQLNGAGGQAQGSVAETGLFLREDGTAGTVQHVDLVA
jgi:hypothetical protein